MLKFLKKPVQWYGRRKDSPNHHGRDSPQTTDIPPQNRSSSAEAVKETTPSTTATPNGQKESESPRTQEIGEGVGENKDEESRGLQQPSKHCDGLSGKDHPSIISEIDVDQCPITNSFRGAHHFIMNNPIMVNTPSPEHERIAMDRLAEKGIAEATLDSFARHPPPFCHPGTREDLRDRIISWVSDTSRKSPLLWLYGSAGVGKSATAQTVGDHFKTKGWFGGAVFLSRPNKRDDPTRVIPSLSHQLAVAYPTFRRVIVNVLTVDSTVLDKALRVQFDELIVKPATETKIDDPGAAPHPVLVLLDGLDECRTDAAQREFIELITNFASEGQKLGLPFVWIITSRPEWQIVSAFAKVDGSVNCWQEELPINSPEALDDVSRFLRDGFQRIRNEYSDAIPQGSKWPSDEQFLVVAFAAGDLFVFADVVLKFVGDDEIGNPVAQLDTCLEFLKGNLIPEGGSPLDPLDALYRGILHTIHPKVLPTTLQVLSIPVLVTRDLHAHGIANLLFLDQATFYGCLRRLKSVLNVPSPVDASTTQLDFHHAYFADFLKQTYRLGDFGVTEASVLALNRKSIIRWYDIQKDKGEECKVEDLSGVVPWPDGYSYSCISQFLREIWRIWSETADRDMSELYRELCNFRFCDVDWREPNEKYFCNLVRRLSTWQDKIEFDGSRRLLRTEVECSTDTLLLQQYACLTEAMKQLDLRVFEPNHEWNCVVLPANRLDHSFQSFQVMRRFLWNPNSMYFFLGCNEKTALVIAYHDRTDAGEYVRAVFAEIRSTFHVFLGDEEHWPSDQHLKLLTIAAERTSRICLGNGSTIMQSIMAFIADPVYGNPIIRLSHIVTALTRHPHDQETVVALICRQILSDTPPRLRQTTERVLAFLSCSASLTPDPSCHIFMLGDICQFLGIGPDEVEKVFQAINPVIFRCRPAFLNANLDEYLSFYPPWGPPGQSDMDELKQHISHFRLGSQAWREISVRYVSWCNHQVASVCTLPEAEAISCLSLNASSSVLPGAHQCVNQESDFTDKILSGFWKAMRIIATQNTTAVVAELQAFRFCHLHNSMVRGFPAMDDFIDFVREFYRLTRFSGLDDVVRV